MTVYTRTAHTALALICAALVNGCAFWPSLTPDKKLNPDNAEEIPCMTTDYSIARKCAQLTIIEISEMLEDVGDFDRAAAYTLLGIGTAAGATLAFEGPDDLLKGLAVGAGSIIGLNAVVNPDAQRVALKAGLRDMSCALRAADALTVAKANLLKTQNKSVGDVLTITPYEATSRLATLRASVSYTALGENEKGQLEANSWQRALRYEALSKSGYHLITALESGNADAGAKLSAAVIGIRAEVREKLSETVPDLEGLAKDQRERIVDIVGEVVRRRAELEDADKEAGQGEDGDEEELSKDAKDFIAETSIVATVFRDCVDSATQRAVEQD